MRLRVRPVLTFFALPVWTTSGILPKDPTRWTRSEVNVLAMTGRSVGIPVSHTRHNFFRSRLPWVEPVETRGFPLVSLT
jgi:hypothetical protein